MLSKPKTGILNREIGGFIWIFYIYRENRMWDQGIVASSHNSEFHVSIGGSLQ